LNQLVQITDNPNIAQVQMTYDAVGNMLSKKDMLRSTKSEAYIYDALNRLASFKQGEMTTGVEISNPLKQVQYNLDALGNRTAVTTNGMTTNYTTNNMNAYTAITGGQNMTPQYDDNGNMTSDGTHTYQYNYNNCLISVDNGATATYKYDALNRRIQKTVVSTGSTTNYYYCGDQAIEERNAADAVQATYVFGISVDDVLQMQRGGNTYYYHKNHLGSVVALTNGSGNLVERYEYDPYGQPFFFDANEYSLSQSVVDNSVLFTGRDYETETSLYYYRVRTMYPNLGCFMQHDPLMYLDGMNLYKSLKNNPIVYIDPMGLFCITIPQKEYGYCDSFLPICSSNLRHPMWTKREICFGEGGNENESECEKYAKKYRDKCKEKLGCNDSGDCKKWYDSAESNCRKGGRNKREFESDFKKIFEQPQEKQGLNFDNNFYNKNNRERVSNHGNEDLSGMSQEERYKYFQRQNYRRKVGGDEKLMKEYYLRQQMTQEERYKYYQQHRTLPY